MPESMPKIVVVAGTHSGCGKTTVSLALMAALVRRGLAVQPFKVGPDFIDPGHHTAIAGRASDNLDSWMLDKGRVLEIVGRNAPGVDVIVAEGVMGLFDGASGADEAGSTAEIAKWLGAPVLLVVDAASQARSAGAVVHGFFEFDPGLDFAGVAFNRVGGENHRQLLAETMAHRYGGAEAGFVAGYLPRDPDLSIPSRHLGLATAEDHGLKTEDLDRLARWLEDSFPLDDLLDKLPVVSSLFFNHSNKSNFFSEKSVRIAVARDQAFCFYYPDVLYALQQHGAEPVYFSPLTDKALPPDIGGVYLGGGYPELHGETLAKNESMRCSILEASESGMPVYAECGGFMYLTRGVADLEGRMHPMAGVFPFSCRMLPKRSALGYREVRLERNCILGLAGTVVRGHEFHYSTLENPVDHADAMPVYSLKDRALRPLPGPEGFLKRSTLGSYVHLHFGSNTKAAKAFAEACRSHAKTRM